MAKGGDDKRKSKNDKKRKKRYGVYKKGGKFRSSKVKEGKDSKKS